jgi:hypothetical protein
MPWKALPGPKYAPQRDCKKWGIYLPPLGANGAVGDVTEYELMPLQF